MGRRKTGGKPYTAFDRNGVATLRTTIAKRKIRTSLGVPWRTDRRGQSEIESLAAKKYAELAAGRVTEKDDRIRTAHNLEELIAMWLVDCEKLYPRSYALKEVHGRTFLKFTASVAKLMADEGPLQFALTRLKSILRTTVRKEVTSLFGFYEWCKAEEYITSIPPRPKLPKGMKGHRAGTQRAKPVPITHAEALALIEALPEWAAKGGRTKDRQKVSNAFRVRDVFRFAYETGLRPGTLNRMRVPHHWKRGQRVLNITEDIDKVSYAREVPLSARAVEILERCAPEFGLIFGKHDYRTHLKAAARAIFSDEAKARDFAAYDFRHGRITHVVTSSQDLLGTAYLAGHRQVTTTNRYLHASQAQAEKALEAVEKLGTDWAQAPSAPQKGKVRRGTHAR